MKPKPAKTPG